MCFAVHAYAVSRAEAAGKNLANYDDMLKKRDFLAGGVGYAISTILVYSAILAGCRWLPFPVKELNPDRSIMKRLFYWDGGHYRRIATNGYSYTPNRPSDVAFFPLYPLTAKLLARCTGMNISIALIAISNCFLAGNFVLLHAYARARFPGQSGMTAACLLTFALYAPTLFFHLPYYSPALKGVLNLMRPAALSP